MPSEIVPKLPQQQPRCKKRWLMLALSPLLTLASSTVSFGQTEEAAAVVDVTPKEGTVADAELNAAKLNLESFDKVWSSIKETHWDPDLGGLDWDACREEFRPTLEAAADINDVRAAMAKLIAKLEQSHFVVLPKELYGGDKKQQEAGNGWSGIEYRFTNDGAVIIQVSEDSPASNAGLKPGLRMTAIDDDSVLTPQQLVDAEKIAERVAFEVAYAKTSSSLSGPVGAERKLRIEDIDGITTDVTLTLADQPGDWVGFGNLPKMNLQIETKMLEKNIGYISLSIFLDPSQVMEKISQFVKNNPDATGMIIDIRGNPGGIGAMAGGIAGWFAAVEQQKLGTMTLRNGNFNLLAFKQKGAYQGPVAVLIDDRSASTSEIFASGMQKSGRARIFGQTTAGAALPAMIEILPNGDRFLHAFASLEDLEGQPIEGIGVIPDQPIPLDRRQLTEGIDPVLQAAIQWITSSESTENK
jgi:carboxyl-terminal processing protease